ncbi:MAG: head GIN domain-containing protein [Cyclobacteriaceae bacterium]
MKHYLITFCLLCCAVDLFGQTRTLDSFSEVSTQESIDVIIKKGNENSAKIIARGIDESEVITRVSGDKLKIELEDNNYRNVDVQVIVTFRGTLEALYASSSGSISVEDPIVNNTFFKLDVSSSGEIDLESLTSPSIDMEASSSGDIKARIDTKRLTAKASSSGEIDIRGKAVKTEIKVSSSGDFEGEYFQTIEADVSASSGGSIKLEVQEEIKARASSGGSIRYSGDPKFVDSSTSSGGSIRG